MTGECGSVICPEQAGDDTDHLVFAKGEIEIACVLEQERWALDLGMPFLTARL